MNQSRREFLKKLPLAMSIPFAIGGIPVQLMGKNKLSSVAAASQKDNVLIILQLHGGNDGLNTLIPIEQYDDYYNLRPNLAIPKKNSLRKAITLDTTLPTEAQIGLHPDMAAIKGMYDSGKVKFIQNVSYANANGSHFRGRDIYFMGGSSDDYYSSGWLGRYIKQEIAPSGLSYPQDFPYEDQNDPEKSMLDPLALEMGSDVSLIFHQEGNIPMSISLSDPQYFADLVGGLEGFQELVDSRGYPPALLQGSPYYNELNWILSLEDKSKSYAERLYEVYKKGGASSVTYPEKYPFHAPKNSYANTLTPQLKLIAQLLGGGCKTKVFLVKVGGFDTHAGQVEAYDTTMGTHAALLYHVSSAMKAFQDDLKIRGLEDRVLTVTTSEFGRRIRSNGSYGTDHGNAGPIMIFGKGVSAGVHGNPPSLQNPGANVTKDIDYREVYSDIMKNWMGVSETDLNIIFPGITSQEGTADGVKYDPSKLQIVEQNITGTSDFISNRFAIQSVYPNPAKEKITIKFRINNATNVSLKLLTARGETAAVVFNGFMESGDHIQHFPLGNTTSGTYIIELKGGTFRTTEKVIVIE